MRKLLALAIAMMVVTAASAAFAEGDDTTGGGEGSGSAATEPKPDMKSAGMSGEAWTGIKKGTMGIQTTFPTGGDAVHADLLWGLNDKALIDLGIGVNFSHGPTVTDPVTGVTTGGTVFGFDFLAGYRMIKPMSGKIRPYLEPAVHLGVGNFKQAGDTVVVGVAAIMGVEYDVLDQVSIGAAIGADLNFANKFKNIDFGLFTSSVHITFWWQ